MSPQEKPNRSSLRFLSSFLLGLASTAALAALPAACQSGGIGDPCVPDAEHELDFAGFDLAEESIESRSFGCSTRICLVNHFQGRVSCPLGQAAPRSCSGLGDDSCGEGVRCVASDITAPACEPDNPLACSKGGVCDPQKLRCVCASDDDCESGSVCDPDEEVCRRFVCHVPGACQEAEASDEENKGKDCCAPGSDRPVSTSVCGQCAKDSRRNAEAAVYCSCRCGPPEGEAPDENFEYCGCPTGYECSEVRQDFGLGDPQLRGKYCIKQGTAYEIGASEAGCGPVSGFVDPKQCVGTAATTGQ